LGGSNRIDFSWSPQYRASDGETLSNQASLGFNWAIVPNRLTLRSAINYDIERELLRDMRHFLTYQGSCYTLRLEYHESKTVSTTRRDYLFSVDLKNVGTFLDLNGGESKGF
jgi:lipopolysaccharide assembly outer membrane protein LptD (OstA)